MPVVPWTDNTKMPWGKHKGEFLELLPASYLLWLYEQPWIKDWPGLHAYLKKNEDLLMAEKRENGDGDDPKSWDDYRNYR